MVPPPFGAVFCAIMAPYVTLPHYIMLVNLAAARAPPGTRKGRHYITFCIAASLPRARAVKMPSAAKAAQRSRAVWKLFTNVFCSPLILVTERLCPCGDDRKGPAVAPP